MYTPDAKKMRTCWRCRKCGFTTPLEEAICSNPSCRAELSLYGESFTPGQRQEPVREEPKQYPPQYDTKPTSSSNLWEESTEKKESRKNTDTNPIQTPKASGKDKAALKKQQAEARLKEAAARRESYNRGPVKTFFVSVLVILLSVLAASFAGGIAAMSLENWGDLSYVYFGYHHFPRPLLWHQIIPGILLIGLSALFAGTAVKEKADRKLLFTAIGFWVIPFAVSCWRGFYHNGGDSYEMLLMYLFFLFHLEPLLVGSAYAGVKGLRAASSILRWICIITLIITGVMAVLLSIDTHFGGIL